MRRRPRARAVVLAVALAAALPAVLVPALAAAAPAAAHGAPAGDAVHYRSRVTAVTPAVPGVSVELARDGSWIRVTNTTDVDLVVLGYDGEPYLRLGPQGAQENLASVTSRVNGVFGTGLVTQDMPTTQAAAAPRWESRGLEPVATWHDARTQYAGTARPPAVAEAPERAHHLTDWTVRGRYGDTPLTIAGTLDWNGKRGLLGSRTSQALWAAGGLAALACVLLVVAGVRRSGGRAPGRLTRGS